MVNIVGVKKRGNKYQWNITHEGIRKFGTSDTLEQAIAARAIAEEKLKNGENIPTAQKKWTVRWACEVTYQTAWKGAKAEGTHITNARDILSYWGKDRDISSITNQDMRDWVAAMEQQGLSNGTINRKLSAFSKVFSTAIENDIISRKPVFPRKREYRGRERVCSEEEEKMLLNIFYSWGKADIAEITIALLDTGMRTGELWRLKAGDIDLAWEGHVGRISLYKTKNDDARTIPLTARLRKIFKAMKVDHLPDNAKVFPYTYKWYLALWNRAKSVMELSHDEQFTPHCLRHTCCTRLIAAGTPLPTVQRWMGHRTIQTTLRYAHHQPKDMLMALNYLEMTKNKG